MSNHASFGNLAANNLDLKNDALINRNLEVSGNIIQGSWELGSLPSEKLVHSSDNGPFGTFSANSLAAIDIARLERLANYFSLKTSLHTKLGS